MEIGDLLFKKMLTKIQKEDLDVKTSAGAIISAPIGTLITLRDQLEKILGKGLIYYTISGSPLYLVHWNDLCEKKRLEIGRKKNVKRNGEEKRALEGRNKEN